MPLTAYLAVTCDALCSLRSLWENSSRRQTESAPRLKPSSDSSFRRRPAGVLPAILARLSRRSSYAVLGLCMLSGSGTVYNRVNVL